MAFVPFVPFVSMVSMVKIRLERDTQPKMPARLP